MARAKAAAKFEVKANRKIARALRSAENPSRNPAPSAGSTKLPVPNDSAQGSPQQGSPAEQSPERESFQGRVLHRQDAQNRNQAARARKAAASTQSVAE